MINPQLGLQLGLKEGPFFYNHLRIFIFKATSTLIIELGKENQSNTINQEMLFELETIFRWLSDHIEIKSVLITNTHKSFGHGSDPDELLKMDPGKANKFNQRIYKLVHSMIHLPQTIVLDLGHGAQGTSLELSIGADIRFAHERAQFKFNHLLEGLMPSAGALGILPFWIAPALIRNWVLSSSLIESKEFLQCGYIFEIYSDGDEASGFSFAPCPIFKTLEVIARQGPIQRIQSKKVMQSTLKELETRKIQEELSLGPLLSEDYKESIRSKLEERPADFTDPRALITALNILKQQGYLHEQSSKSPSPEDPHHFKPE
jgi:enoyl-CoA hydratase/carnithine racemase